MDVGDGSADEGLLDRAEHTVAVTRTDVPGGRGDHLVVLDLAVLQHDPVRQRPAGRLGGTEALARRVLGRFGVEAVAEAELVEPLAGPLVVLGTLVDPSELTGEDRRALLGQHVLEQRILILVGTGAGTSGDDPTSQRAGLEGQVSDAGHVVAGRLGPRVLALLATDLGVDRIGDALPRMEETGVVVERVLGVLAHPKVIELEVVPVGVDARTVDQRRVATVDRRVLVQVGLEVGAGGDEVADALAVGVETDVEGVADEEAEIGVVVPLVLVDPGHDVVPGLVLEPALEGAPEPLLLHPETLPVLEDGDRPRHLGQGRGAHHAARDHEARMGPLAAEHRVDLDRLRRQDHALLVALADVGGEAADRLVVHRRTGVVLVGEIDREQRVEVARDRLQGLARLGDVADQRGVLGDVGLPGRVERIGRLVEVGAATDPADAGRDDQPGLRVLALQDHLEPAEHAGRGPGRGDDPVLDRDPHVEVALDTSQGADVQIDGTGLGDLVFDTRHDGWFVRRRTCPPSTTRGRRPWPRRRAPCR